MTRTMRVACIPMVVLALLGLAACRKRAPSDSGKESKSKTSAKVTDPDDEDENGDPDEDDSVAPAAVSELTDAEETRLATLALLAKDMPDPIAAAKKNGPPKVELKKDPRGSCGEIRIGGQAYKLDCDTEGYGEVKGAGVALIDEEEIGASSAPTKLPDVVDFRTKNQVGPVIDQGGSLSCTAVSLAHVVNHEIALRTGKPGAVSAMQMWGRYANPSMDEAIKKNEGKGIAPAALLPYDWRTADKWDKTSPPSPSTFTKLDGQAVADVIDVVKLNPKSVKGTLAQGHAVWFAIHGAHGLQKTEGSPGGPQVVPAYDYQTMPSSQRMCHAMALMGYRVKDGKTYYLLQNSWGTGYGEKGYAYLDETTFMKNVKYAYSVEVVPKGSKAKTNAGVGATKCTPGHLPDAQTGKCALKCADGSARNGNVCAAASTACGAGMVNVNGRCVRAAPTLKTKKDGIAANCVPGGCAYAIDKGAFGCTRVGGCVITCAAPTFKLVRNGTKLTCN